MVGDSQGHCLSWVLSLGSTAVGVLFPSCICSRPEELEDVFVWGAAVLLTSVWQDLGASYFRGAKRKSLTLLVLHALSFSFSLFFKDLIFFPFL